MTFDRKKRRPHLIALVTAIGVLGWAGLATAASGPHSDKGCAMCHTPHNSILSDTGEVIVPLWTPASLRASWDGVTVDGAGNHVLTYASEQHTATILTGPTYTSDTMDAAEAGNAITTPSASGASVLCLSCHDGTHSSSSHKFVDTASSGNMGTLSASHPIGITYASAAATDTALKPEADLEPGVLDGLGKVGCPSCHDIHSTADTTAGWDSYLRWAYLDDSHRVGATAYGSVRSDDFCRHCHIK